MWNIFWVAMKGLRICVVLRNENRGLSPLIGSDLSTVIFVILVSVDGGEVGFDSYWRYAEIPHAIVHMLAGNG